MVGVSVVAGVGLVCGGAVLAVQWNGERQERRSDQVAREYFEALRRDDAAAARGLMCADADLRRARFESVDAFTVESVGDWGSPMDGSGRRYFVRVVLANGDTTTSWLTTEYREGLEACVDWEDRKAPTGRS
ncbi:hypothetical protein GCM10007977_019640 [Dactylosporangium sucinum]|uniref:Uncharacterized protein n=1 Tax=Dactylosporangium sucinum TaxID=1424081 RepID=A0A917TCH1_9ACTN|nr:hypothetical protein GCM10007977_019640 [Dactylosporangium sucinum]